MKKILYFMTFILALNAVNAGAVDSKWQTSPGARNASYDIQFIDTMTAHHKQELELMQIALKRSQNQEIRQKVNALAATLQSEISKLQAARGYVQQGAAPAINMNMSGMKAVDFKKIQSRKAKDFDEEFLEVLIDQEEGGLQMTSTAINDAKNIQVKEAALEISNRQTTTIGELEALKDKQ